MEDSEISCRQLMIPLRIVCLVKNRTECEARAAVA